MNLVGMIGMGIDKISYGISAAVANAQVDVKDLLSGDGAAGQGGALEEVNKQVQQYGKGGFTIVQTLAVYGVAIAMIIAAILLAWYAGNPNKREEQKNALGWIFVAAVLIFAGIAILVFAQKIGSALFG